MPLHVSNTMCSSSGGKNCIIKHLVSSHLQMAVRCTGWGRRGESSLNLCAGWPPTVCDDTRCCIIQFWRHDDENIVLETCRGISIYLSGFFTAVAVFQKPNAVPLCFSIDLVLNVLSWLLVLLPSTFFLDVLFPYYKTKICALSWLITKIILKCTVRKTKKLPTD